MPDISTQEDFYNKRWSTFDYANRLKLKRAIGILSELSDLRLEKPAILDLGSGAGWLTSILGCFGPTTGVELSVDAVNKARDDYPNVSFVQADINTWDYPKEVFDIVVSHEVVEHFEDQKTYLHIAYELLKPGGYLILTTPNAHVFNAMSLQKRQNWSNQPIENWLNSRDLDKLLRQQSFDVIKISGLIADYYNIDNSRWPYLLSRLFRKFNMLSYYESIRLKLGYGLHLIAVSQKTCNMNSKV